MLYSTLKKHVEDDTCFIDDWSLFQDYRYNHGHHQAHVTGLPLDPGRLYRFVVKLCARETCYQPVHSNGVLVLANPPVTNTIRVQHDNNSASEKVRLRLRIMFGNVIHYT